MCDGSDEQGLVGKARPHPEACLGSAGLLGGSAEQGLAGRGPGMPPARCLTADPGPFVGGGGGGMGPCPEEAGGE